MLNINLFELEKPLLFSPRFISRREGATSKRLPAVEISFSSVVRIFFSRLKGGGKRRKERKAAGHGIKREKARAREESEETRNRLTREDGLKSAKHCTRRACTQPPSAFLPPLRLPLFAVFASSCLCEAVTPGCRPSLPRSTFYPPSYAVVLCLPFTTCSRLILAGLGMHSSLVFSLPLIPPIVPSPLLTYTIRTPLSLPPRSSTMGRNISTSGQKSLHDGIIRFEKEWNGFLIRGRPFFDSSLRSKSTRKRIFARRDVASYFFLFFFFEQDGD